MQNTDDGTGNGSRDLPVCSAVPQPLRAPKHNGSMTKKKTIQYNCTLNSVKQKPWVKGAILVHVNSAWKNT
jgi:hypothetical protein